MSNQREVWVDQRILNGYESQADKSQITLTALIASGLNTTETVFLSCYSEVNSDATIISWITILDNYFLQYHFAYWVHCIVDNIKRWRFLKIMTSVLDWDVRGVDSILTADKWLHNLQILVSSLGTILLVSDIHDTPDISSDIHDISTWIYACSALPSLKNTGKKQRLGYFVWIL